MGMVEMALDRLGETKWWSWMTGAKAAMVSNLLVVSAAAGRTAHHSQDSSLY